MTSSKKAPQLLWGPNKVFYQNMSFVTEPSLGETRVVKVDIFKSLQLFAAHFDLLLFKHSFAVNCSSL